MKKRKIHMPAFSLQLFHGLLIAFSLALFPASPCQAHHSKKIVRIATLDNYYPYCFRITDSPRLASEIIKPGEDSSQLAGFDWDFVRTSLHNAGFTIDLRIGPWARVEHYIRNYRADIYFPAIITPNHSKELAFSRVSMDSVNIVIYANVPLAPSEDVMKGIIGKSIGVMRDWSFGSLWEMRSDVSNHPVDSIGQAFRMLEKKRLDAVIGYEKTFDHFLANKGKSGHYWKSTPVEILRGYVACRASDKFGQAVLSAFDAQAMRLIGDGTAEHMAQKWRVPVPVFFRERP